MPDAERLPKIFRFVNKDASSISPSQGKTGQAGVFEINSHVQRVRRLRRQTQLLQETSSTKKLVGWQKAPIERGQGEDGNDATLGSPSTHCRKCHLDHNGQRCPSDSVDVPIGSASDPFKSLVLPIDVKVHRILQYYMKLRQPRGSNADSHIAGFTPLGKRDERLSLQVVKNSLSSPANLHAIALLAGMACRMKFTLLLACFNLFRALADTNWRDSQFNGVSLAPRDYPENYTVRAIQAFRKYIDDGEPITDQVVFAMHNLSMAEYACRNFAGAKLYWKMTREMVIHLGGFAKFEPYIAWLCLSADYLIAASTFTLPELDFIRYPKLSSLDITNATEKAEAKTAALDGSTYCQPRLQVLITDAVSLAQVIGYIQNLSDPAVLRVKKLVMANRTAVYRLITMPLKQQTLASSPSIDGALSVEGLDSVVLADAVVARARHLGLVIWLWYSSLSLLPILNLPQSLAGVPSLIAEHVIEMRTSLQLAERKLADSRWAVREDLLLWLCSLISLISSTLEGNDFFVPRFVRTTKQLDIHSERQLEAALKVYPPLSSVDENSVSKLYRLISMTSVN